MPMSYIYVSKNLRYATFVMLLSLFSMHLATSFARTDTKVGTVPTCLRRIFSPCSQFYPITLPDSCFRFASREQSRQVENRL